jgi:hypothetical protein
VRYEFRPLDWAGPSSSPGARAESRFKASYHETIDLLFAEADKLGASHLVLQVDLAERDIRADGLPRANARYGTHPGVIVSFDSRHGPLRYATDAFGDWRANLRAIALSLKALRDVDRYGVSKRGEQYTGWKALPAPGNGSRHFTSADDALRWMRAQDGLEGGELPPGALYRKLARRMHPDLPSGSRSEWNQLDSARQLLVTAGML